MAQVRFHPFRARDVHDAWLGAERFWPCPPVVIRQPEPTVLSADLSKWLAEETMRLVREEEARIQGWVMLSLDDEKKRGVIVIRQNPGGPIMYINLDESVPQGTIHEYPWGKDDI